MKHTLEVNTSDVRFRIAFFSISLTRMNQWFGCSFPKLLKSVGWTSLPGRGEDTGMREVLRLTVSDESSHEPHGNAVFQGCAK